MKRNFLFLIALVILAFASDINAQNIPNYVPKNGLVGWWPFNGNANDESVNGNNGTVNGAVLTTDRFGNTDKAYRFFPEQFIEILNSEEINFSDSLSINVWYKNYLINGSVFVSKHSYGSLNSSFVVYNEENTGSCGPVSYITDINNSINTVRNLSLCDTSGWHMITFVFEKPILKMYCDGILFNQTNSETVKSSSNKILFGASIPTSQSITNAKLDDIGIWDRALTEEEVKDLYNSELCEEIITVTDTLKINLNKTSYKPVRYSNTIKIFPNPTNDQITIDYGDFATLNGYELSIENSLGQQMHQEKISQQSTNITIGSWAKGIYFVNIKNASGNNIDIKKIVLE